MLHYCAPGKIHTRCRALHQAMLSNGTIYACDSNVRLTSTEDKTDQTHAEPCSQHVPNQCGDLRPIEIQEPWLPVTIRVSLMSVWISSGNVPWLLKAVARSRLSHENQISISKHLYIQDKLNKTWKTNINPLKTIDNTSILFNTGYQKTTRCSPRTRMQ